MTTWLKKLRLYLLRRQLNSLVDNIIRRADAQVDQSEFEIEFMLYQDQRADLINRIAEIDKTL